MKKQVITVVATIYFLKNLNFSFQQFKAMQDLWAEADNCIYDREQKAVNAINQ